MCIGSCDLSTERHYPGIHYTFLHILAAISQREPPYLFSTHFPKLNCQQHDENCYCEKGNQNCTHVKLRQPYVGAGQSWAKNTNAKWNRCGTIDATSHRKIPVGSTPAAVTKPRTRGDSRTSRTVPPASTRALSSRTGAPSPSSRCSQSSSQHNRSRDPNPLRSDWAAQRPIASGDQGGTS